MSHQREPKPDPDLSNDEKSDSTTASPSGSRSYLQGIVASDIETQAQAITHPSLSKVQRQIMAASIAQRRGNSHMRSVVDSLQRSPSPDLVQREGPAYAKDTIAEIESELNTWWVGPLAESRLFQLWEAFGADLPNVVADQHNFDLFKKSHAAGAELDDLQISQRALRDFPADVKALALQYLALNEQTAIKEMESIGLAPNMSLPFGTENEEKLKELRKTVIMIQALKQLQTELRGIPVGYSEPKTEFDGMAHFTVPSYPMNFDPSGPPPRPPKDGDKMMPWEQVNAVYQQAEGAVGRYAAQNPAIVPLLSDPDQLAAFANEESPLEAQHIIGAALNSSLDSMKKSRAAISSGDLDPRELKPIHRQLMSGQKKGPSNTDWSQNFFKWAGEESVGDYESTQFWITLGLGAATAIAFIVAEVATMGTATFFIAAGAAGVLTGVTVARSWDQYFDLAAAGKSSIRSDTQLVDQGQVDMALLSAILDTGFALLDVFQLGKAMKAGRAGMAAMKLSTKSIKEVATLSAAEAEPIFMRTMTEHGVNEAIKRSGMSAESLIAKFGEHSMVGQMVKAGAGGAEALKLMPQIGKIAAEQGTTAANDIVMAAIRQNGAKDVLMAGGGWTKLTKTLGDDAVASKALFEWREQVYREIEAFTTRGAKEGGDDLIVKTGTSKPTSDLDMSFLGSSSAKNRQEAFEFIKLRLGIASREDLLKLLDMDMFTDPVRNTLYKELPAEVSAQLAKKAAARERELIFAERLYHARQMAAKEGREGVHGRQLVERIESQMQTLGIADIGYKPLSPDQVSLAASKVDELHQALERSLKSGGPIDEQMKLADQIAQYQAMINAAEKGGYISGGGVERFVTNRKNLEILRDSQRAAGEIVTYPMSKPEVFAAAVDQMLKLDHYAVELKGISEVMHAAKPSEVFDAVKGVSKYGERLGDMSQALMGSSAATAGLKKSSGTLATAHEELAKLLAASGKAATDPLIQQIARDSSGVVQKALGALDMMDSSMDNLLAAMQKQANLSNIPGALEGMDQMVRTQAEQLAATAALKAKLGKTARALEDILDLGQKAALANDQVSDPDAPNMSEPAPTVEEVFNSAYGVDVHNRMSKMPTP